MWTMFFGIILFISALCVGALTGVATWWLSQAIVRSALRRNAALKKEIGR